MTRPMIAVLREPAAESGFAMPTTLHLILLALLIVGAAMWIGGMATVTMLTIISHSVLEPAQRTALFKRLGRSYFPIFGAALVVAAIAGLVLLLARGWDGLAWAIVILVVAIMVALAFGVVQARTMSGLRGAAAALRESDAPTEQIGRADRAVARGARGAVALRASLGILSAAVFVLAICTAA